MDNINTNIIESVQNNGDIFCFDYDTNIKFQHGISKLKTKNPDNLRISIIIWGKQN